MVERNAFAVWGCCVGLHVVGLVLEYWQDVF